MCTQYIIIGSFDVNALNVAGYVLSVIIGLGCQFLCNLFMFLSFFDLLSRQTPPTESQFLYLTVFFGILWIANLQTADRIKKSQLR